MSKCENNGQLSTLMGLTQSQVSTFLLTVLVIRTDEQGIVEEDFFGLYLRHGVLNFTFATVTRVPMKSDDQIEINHFCAL